MKNLIPIVMGFMLGCIIVQGLEIRKIKNTMANKNEIRNLVLESVSQDSQLYNLLDAKRDCELIIDRTQECILVFDYVPMEK